MRKNMLFLIFLSLLSGCATIVKSDHQSINFMTSNNQQVEAIISSANGQIPVTLPTALSVKNQKQDIIVNIKETQCTAPSTTIVPSKVHAWFWGNFIIGGLFGSTTDSVTGSMWSYDDNVIVSVVDKKQCS